MQIRAQTVTSFAIGFLALTISACNSNSQPTPTGNICAAGYNPITQTPGPNQKTYPTDPNENKALPPESQMPAGQYTYVAADIIYKEKPVSGSLPLKIQFRDEATSGTSVRQTIFCSENAKPGMNVPQTQALVPTDIIVCKDLHQIVRGRLFTFSIVNTRIQFGPPMPDSANWCSDSAQKLAGKENTIFMKDDDNNYEFRQTRDIGPGTFDLSAHMSYTGFPNGIEPADCRQCTPPTTPIATPKANPQPFQRPDDNQNRPDPRAIGR